MRRDAKKRGFTLVELMLVVVIIGLLAGFALPNLFSQLGRAKIGKAVGDLSLLDQALELYAMQVGEYPSTDEGMNALVINTDNKEGWAGPYLKKKVIPKDPWGNSYIYRKESAHNQDYDLLSMGPDKQENTDDDVTNWEIEKTDTK